MRVTGRGRRAVRWRRRRQQQNRRRSNHGVSASANSSSVDRRYTPTAAKKNPSAFAKGFEVKSHLLRCRFIRVPVWPPAAAAVAEAAAGPDTSRSPRPPIRPGTSALAAAEAAEAAAAVAAAEPTRLRAYRAE